MDLKFTQLLTRFFPTGKIWEFQANLFSLFEGVSIEFSRVYELGNNFHREFNLVESETYASEHSEDYLIRQGIYTNLELQRIVVNYMNKDIEFKAAIEDFAAFINVPITWLNLPAAFEFGVFQFGDEFGDPTVSPNMELLIEFDSGVTCQEYRKVRWLVEFLKPPYLKVTFSNEPVLSIQPFEFGVSQFGDAFGESIPCEL